MTAVVVDELARRRRRDEMVLFVGKREFMKEGRAVEDAMFVWCRRGWVVEG